MQLEVAVEGFADALFEIAARVQARDFVFVLVGHQLECVAGDGFGQRREARRLRLLGGAHLVDQRLVLLRVRGVLVVGQERDATRDLFVERRAETEVVECRGIAVAA